MAITRTDLGGNNAKAATSVILVSSITVSAGDTLIVLTSTDNNTGITVKLQNSGGSDLNTFANDKTLFFSGNVAGNCFRLSSPTTGSNLRVQLSATNSQSMAGRVIKVTGLPTDVTPINSSGGTGSASPYLPGISGTYTVAPNSGADVIIFGVVAAEGPGDDTAGTWSLGLGAGGRSGTTGGGAAGNVTINEGFVIQSTTYSQTNAAIYTPSTARDYTAFLVGYQEATSGTPLTLSVTDDLNAAF